MAPLPHCAANKSCGTGTHAPAWHPLPPGTLPAPLCSSRHACTARAAPLRHRLCSPHCAILLTPALPLLLFVPCVLTQYFRQMKEEQQQGLQAAAQLQGQPLAEQPLLGQGQQAADGQAAPAALQGSAGSGLGEVGGPPPGAASQKPNSPCGPSLPHLPLCSGGSSRSSPRPGSAAGGRSSSGSASLSRPLSRQGSSAARPLVPTAALQAQPVDAQADNAPGTAATPPGTAYVPDAASGGGGLAELLHSALQEPRPQQGPNAAAGAYEGGQLGDERAAPAAALVEQVVAKQGLLRTLEAQREQLHSAQSDRQARRHSGVEPHVEERLKSQLRQVR